MATLGDILSGIGGAIKSGAELILDPAVIQQGLQTYTKIEEYRTAQDIAEQQADLAKSKAAVTAAENRAKVQVLTENPEVAFLLSQDPGGGTSPGPALVRGLLGVGSAQANETPVLLAGPVAQTESDQVGLLLMIAIGFLVLNR